jgi:hypothetical protein
VRVLAPFLRFLEKSATKWVDIESINEDVRSCGMLGRTFESL